jgi:hypothetical protein
MRFPNPILPPALCMGCSAFQGDQRPHRAGKVAEDLGNTHPSSVCASKAIPGYRRNERDGVIERSNRVAAIVCQMSVSTL